MREYPILYAGQMVRQILAGYKTETRRIVKLPDGYEHNEVGAYCGLTLGMKHHLFCDPGPDIQLRCPYGVPGDRLWVRETWQAIHVYRDFETGHGEDFDVAVTIPKDDGGGWWRAVHAATDPQRNSDKDDRGFLWRPSIHMPRWACRLLLDVVSVRAERLQDITETGAIAEGVASIEEYRVLWDSLAPVGSRWVNNPWVWVVGFKVAPREMI